MAPLSSKPCVDWCFFIVLFVVCIFQKMCSKGGWCARCFVAVGVIHDNWWYSIGFDIYIYIYIYIYIFCILGGASGGPWPFTLHSSGNSTFPIQSNGIWWISLAEGYRLFKKHLNTIVILMFLVQRFPALFIKSCCLTPQLWVSPGTKHRCVGLRV